MPAFFKHNNSSVVTVEMLKFNLPHNEIGFSMQCADFQAISTLSEKKGGSKRVK